MSYILALVGLLLLGFQLSASGVDFSRYAPILERRPFASLVTNADIVEPVVTLVAPPAFVKDLRMCAITESPAGVRVGFVNIKARPPQPYYLYVGDSEDGIELVDADYIREGALIRKDSEQYWLYMRGEAAVESSRPTVPHPTRSLTHSRNRAIPSVTHTPAASPISGSSYAERRRRRLDEMRQRAADSRKESDSDVEKRLQEYQMDLIRKGLTPLPIPLTEEMDSQLVKEGVLPPVEGE